MNPVNNDYWALLSQASADDSTRSRSRRGDRNTWSPYWALTRGLQFPDVYRFLPIFRTFLGDFAPDRLDSRSLQTLLEWKNRVLLEERYIFNVVIPLEVE